LCGKSDDTIQVWDKPEITNRSARVPATCDRVVHEENVEYRRHPHAPEGRAVEARDRNALHPHQSTGVHVGERHGDYAV
jgi:hypothetical protein